MSIINISGKKYTERPTYKNKIQPSVYATLAMFAIMGMGLPKGSTPDVNIIEQFDLIQQKKSNLSKAQRDWVVNQFYNRFMEVKDETTEI